MGVFLAGVGIWCAWALGRRIVGATIVLVGLGWSCLALLVFVPHFAGHDSAFYGAYASVGGSPAGIAKTAATHPGVVISAVTEPRDLAYVVLLVLPLAGAFLLAPAVAALALPQFGLNLLADVPGTTDPHEHYSAAILPFLFAATALGVGRLAPRRQERAALMVATVAVAAAITIGPWPGSLLGTARWDPLDTSPEHLLALERAVALVPDDAAVTSTNRVGSRLAERQYYYNVPVVRRARWAVIEETDDWMPTAYSGEARPLVLRAFERRLATSAGWRRVFDQDGIVVYRRTTP
jgi:uncharacterized membrane protein